MSIKQGRIGGDAKAMRGPMDVEPLFSADLKRKKLLAHALGKNFCTAPREGGESRLFKLDENRFYRLFGDARGPFDFDRRIRFDPDVRIRLAQRADWSERGA